MILQHQNNFSTYKLYLKVLYFMKHEFIASEKNLIYALLKFINYILVQ